MKTIWITCCCCLLAISAFSQQQRPEKNSLKGTVNDTAQVTVNLSDEKGRRHGLWWEKFAASLGEAAYTAFGAYDHGQKIGPWYKINEIGDLVAIENFRFNNLHGEAKYFELGNLVCVGNFRSLDPSSSYDTFIVVHPVTGVEKLVSVPTTRGSVRHGIWRYYDNRTGRMIKEEEYMVDELVQSKTFGLTPADSSYFADRERKMPHNQPLHYKPPKGKGGSLTELK